VTVKGEPAEREVHFSALRDPRLWLGSGLLLLVLAGILVAVYLGRRGPSLAAAKLPPVPPLQGAPGLLRGDVGTVGSGNFSVINGAGDARTVSVGPSTRVEALVRSQPSSVAVGDYLTVGGIPNQVYSFAVKLVVDIPAAEAQPAASGPPRSKGGFTGWEAYADPRQMPEVYGRVESIDADGFHLSGTLGPITVKLDDGSALRRLTSGGLDLIHGGDHVALAPSPSPPPAVLAFGEQ
jgi:hypothetical protein